MDDTVTACPDATEGRGTLARRRLLGAGVGGAALSLLPMLARRAAAGSTTTTPGSTTTAPGSATTTPGSTTSTTPATTTTAPPLRPTDDDATLLDFAQGLELAARRLYDGVLAVQGWTPEQLTVLGTIREGHSSYANSLSGLLGRIVAGRPDAGILDEVGAAFEGDPATLLDAAYELESRAVATHLDILGKLRGTDGAALIASIVNVEARYGTVLAALAGKTDLPTLLVTSEAAAFSPAGG